MRALRWGVMVTIAIVGATCRASTSVENPKACRSLAMDMARNDIDGSGRGTATLTIDRKDLSLRNLLCVAERLDREHPDWAEVRVAVFDSVDVADNYIFDWQTVDATFPPAREHAYESLRRAVYVVSKLAAARYLQFRLFGSDDERYQTRINLPVTEPPRCRFEIKGRCLLVAYEPPFPRPPSSPVSGSVTVAAELHRDGTFQGVRVTKAVAQPAEAAAALGVVALESLRRWRLDASSSEDSVTVDFRFVSEIKAAPGRPFLGIPLGVSVEMTSPTSITVRQEIR